MEPVALRPARPSDEADDDDEAAETDKGGTVFCDPSLGIEMES